MENEIWLAVIAYEGLYEVSNLGRVRRMPKKVGGRWGTARLNYRVMKGSIYDGYRFVGLTKDSKPAQRAPVHRLVAEAFIGPRPESMEICHGDGNRMNNAVANLRYATRKENHANMVLHGTRIVGVNHHSTPLSEEDVVNIRAFEMRHGGMKELVARYGISQVALGNIRARRTWKHLP